MRKAILGKTGVAVVAAALTFSGASTVFADEVSGGNQKTDEGILIEQSQDESLLNSDQTVYADLIERDFNVEAQSVLSSLTKGDTLTVTFESSNPVFSKQTLEAIKSKGVETSIYDVTDIDSTVTAGSRMPGIVTIENVTDTSSEFNPLITANTDKAAADKLKSAGVNHFFTISTAGASGTKLPGTCEFFAYCKSNIGSFDIDKTLYCYYYQQSDGRFVEIGEDDFYVRYERHSDGSKETAYDLYNCTLNGTYVFTEGKIPSSSLAAGYTGLAKSGSSWYYYKNGSIDYTYNGLCKYNGSWWYVKNGKIDFGATTLCKYNGTWWYVQNGKVNFNATTLCKYNGSWFYVSGGQVRFGATGLCKYNGTWWYVQNGKVNFSATTLCKYNGKWWYVKGGKVSFTTTLCKYNGTWWYINNGAINFSKTTLVKYGSNWYAVAGGKVAWNYTGRLAYNGRYYNVVKGVVKF